ncbi:glycerate kinase family protein [Aquipuribacter sp. MA13-6]|uniref:glycerate kinase family protein n=1 Tax=unclassified Aquipuribacter TaxID=2635084 RepID=UPI003EE93579
MRVVMAPDCFTGTLTARQAAAAMAEGWWTRAPGDDVVTVPLSDGGPGFVDALTGTLPGRLLTSTVSGPTGEPVPATVLVVEAADDPSGLRSAYLESAQACGSHLVAPEARDPAVASSLGVGQLLLAALEEGAERVVVGLGGSATVDGGAGLLAALGVRAGATRLDRGPRGLAGLAPDALTGLPAARERLAGVELVVASDVDVPLLGRHGAVHGFGRQKGVTAEQLPALEAVMTAWATAVLAAAGAAGAPDPGRLVALPGAGAAGGLGFALLALGATRRSGAEAVASAVGLADRLGGADLVLTGEGSFDWQSLRGKVIAGVAHVAGSLGVPVVVVAGQVAVGRRELAVAGVEAAYAVADTPEQVAASMAAPAARLAARTARVAGTWHR